MATHRFSNDEIADLFEQVADLLATQNANPFRVRAYREAGHRIRIKVHLNLGIHRNGL